MTRRTMLVAVALSSLLAAKAAANYFDGNELLAWCENWHREMDPDDDLLLGGYCGGFVGGVVDTLVNKPHTFCVPQGPGGVSSAQLVEVVKLYLRDHPDNRHLAASLLVMQALKEKFPCPE
jgi:Rap1a immunity proteins